MVWLHGEWWEERNVLCLKEGVAFLLQCIEFFFLSWDVAACLDSGFLQKQVFLPALIGIHPFFSCTAGRATVLLERVKVLFSCSLHTILTAWSEKEREAGSVSYLHHYSGFPLHPHLASACPPSRLSERELVCPSDNLTLIQISCIRSRGRLYSQSELQPRTSKGSTTKFVLAKNPSLQGEGRYKTWWIWNERAAYSRNVIYSTDWRNKVWGRSWLSFSSSSLILHLSCFMMIYVVLQK